MTEPHDVKAIAYVWILPRSTTASMSVTPDGRRRLRWPSSSAYHSPGASKAAAQPSRK